MFNIELEKVYSKDVIEDLREVATLLELSNVPVLLSGSITSVVGHIYPTTIAYNETHKQSEDALVALGDVWNKWVDSIPEEIYDKTGGISFSDTYLYNYLKSRKRGIDLWIK